MIRNCSLTLIQTENGFILRPLASHTEVDPDTRKALVFETIDQVHGYLSQHFEQTVCPGCKRVGRRAEHWADFGDVEFVYCRGCNIMRLNAPGMEWFEMANLTYSRPFSDPEFAARWAEQVAQLKKALRS